MPEQSGSTAPMLRCSRWIGAASSGLLAHFRSPRCSSTSRRSTTLPSPCRRMPATRFASGAMRGGSRSCASRRARSAPMPTCGAPISASSRWSAMAEPRLLELSNVETCYGLSQVLFGVTLVVAPGEMVTLMGRNGMGKTTTVRSIMGLTPALAGSIRFDGAEIRGLPAYRVAKLGIGLVPEGRQVFPNLTARENLIATAANRASAADPWTLGKICALLPRLAERRDSMASELSGGEQQMLAIGRALMT